jgi:hypothetical protein
MYVSVVKVWNEPIVLLSGNNITEFTDVKLSFLFSRRCLNEQAEQEVSDSKRNVFPAEV